MALANATYTRTNGAEAGKGYPRFFIDTVDDPVASEREGHPVCRDEERVEIIFPGNQLTRPVMKVTREHTERWPEEYKAFKSGQELAANGVPLEQWPLLRPAQIRELKLSGFRTVEDVSAMDDHAIQRMGMGGRRVRDLAIAYLDDAKAGAMLSQSTAALERADARVAELEEKVNNLGALCDRLHSQLQGMMNAPSPVATYVPGQHDPAEAYRQARPQEEAAPSSLLDLPSPRKRGKPAEGVAG